MNEYVAQCEPGFISFGGGCVCPPFIPIVLGYSLGMTMQGRTLWTVPGRVSLGRLVGAVSDVWEPAVVCRRGTCERGAERGCEGQGGRVV